ncbi:hypothetical protein OR1_00975 [Geobacter sp. OR-1]|uniref:nickel pincer cofactor biosynthesis protein LarC n=1 Tax=Geobacter sp. OR-1 TaxID=1266765 RepID=UPI000541D749|nr:nickel pincer cofactor biosynthesis protein LarC [Geobacter sp. OR-1]GAM08702.1 hypothetical protein OR1_00975 [Geobacter sp. OR-1]
MKTLFLDCAAGISGDMTIGALLDLGVPMEVLQTGLAQLSLPPGSFRISAAKTTRLGIAATHFMVEAPEQHHHRCYSDIKELISVSGLNETVRSLSQKIFLRVAEAEAAVHGVSLDKVHFHEVGAVDSIVDIVGTAIGLDYLGMATIASSPLPFGSGWVETAHGRLPVPAPATAELFKGLRVTPDNVPGEWVTPTGAAIIAALSTAQGPAPEMTITAIGYGAGTKECQQRPNLLRAFLGDVSPRESILVMETHLDDINPEIMGFLMDRLFEAGALDVAFSPLQMKKNRPGFRLTVITDKAHLDGLANLVFTESTAIGTRYYPVERRVLERNTASLDTALGPVNVKKVRLPDGSFRTYPEFEECRRLAIELGMPLPDVYRLIEKTAAEEP